MLWALLVLVVVVQVVLLAWAFLRRSPKLPPPAFEVPPADRSAGAPPAQADAASRPPAGRDDTDGIHFIEVAESFLGLRRLLFCPLGEADLIGPAAAGDAA